jgi:hypothetical protein
MITWTKLQGYFIYLYAGIYGLGALIGFLSSLLNDFGTGILFLIVFAPIAYLLHLYAQAHFRIARRAENYIKFCKVHGISDDKEHSEEYFRLYKKEVK